MAGLVTDLKNVRLFPPPIFPWREKKFFRQIERSNLRDYEFQFPGPGDMGEVGIAGAAGQDKKVRGNGIARTHLATHRW